MALRWVARRMMQQLTTGQRAAMHSLTPSPLSPPPSSSEGVMSTCGRGDKKTKRGKRFKGSYGNCRPKRKQKIERIKDRIEVPRSTPWPLPFKLI